MQVAEKLILTRLSDLAPQYSDAPSIGAAGARRPRRTSLKALVRDQLAQQAAVTYRWVLLHHRKRAA